MGGAVSATPSKRERGMGPFAIFGIALVVAAAWAVYMGVAFLQSPNFVVSALPTIVGVSVAVVAILVIALIAPRNE